MTTKAQASAIATSAEWQILLECAKTQRHRERLETLLAKPDWERLLTLAEAHGVINLLATRIREASSVAVPAAFREQLLELQRAQLLSGLGLIAEMIRVLERLEAENIAALVLKGPALSLQAYGDATARQYGDIDILVRQRDIVRATEALIDLGFGATVAPQVVAAGKIPGEYFFSRPGTKVILEVHTERTLRYFPNPLEIEGLFARRVKLAFEGREVPTLSAEDALVSMCTHGAKHFWERLMWIADVAAMIARQRNLDWEATAALAEKLGAERILHSGLFLAVKLLEVQLPVSLENELQADTGAAALAGKVETWLPQGDGASIGLLARAVFRAQMRGGFWAGLGYVARLSLSPTEADWQDGREHKRSHYGDSVRRLFRLASKYGRDSDS